jgi:hypothetical protein
MSKNMDDKWSYRMHFFKNGAKLKKRQMISKIKKTKPLIQRSSSSPTLGMVMTVEEVSGLKVTILRKLKHKIGQSCQGKNCRRRQTLLSKCFYLV